MLCNNAWVDISWDGNLSRTKKENLKFTVKRQASTLVDFDQACNKVASEIYDSFKNLYVGLSGGSDSEYVATCLARNKIPFTPLIIDYGKYQKVPQYELWYAYQWCKQHQITPKVINIEDYPFVDYEKEIYNKIKPRLFNGGVTIGLLYHAMKDLGGKLITGNQLEYYPDHEQMTYLEPQLGDYNGFVLEESDYYLETVEQDVHPWAFFYWSPEIMSSFVNSWDCNLTMQENKSAIYKTSLRPKFGYTANFYTDLQGISRKALSKNWGTLDCALLGTKEQLLAQLLE